MLLDQGAQSSFSGVLAPQLLGFALDLLDSLFAPLDRDPIFVHPLLVTGISTPIQRRDQVARRIPRTQ